MRPLNAGLIGFGLAGRVFHAPLIAAVDGLNLAAVVTSRADEVAKRYPAARVLASAEALFADSTIDFVVVATPNDSHFDLAARALDAGKHVVIDKPFAQTAAEAEALIARSAGRVLTVFHNRRWDSDFLTLKRLIGEGALREVFYFESHFDRFRPKPKGGWREQAGISSGIWYDLGSHLLDQALQLFGRPLAITADLATRRDGAAATDYFRVLLRYKKQRIVLTGDMLGPADYRRFIVHGTRGSYIKHGLDAQEAYLAGGGTPRDATYGLDPQPGHIHLPSGEMVSPETERGNYTAFYAGVRDCLHGRAPLPVTAREALTVMHILQAGVVSADERREVAL